MGVRFRKSMKLPGGVRVNASKSGIGYSYGGKGFRVTKTAKGTTRTTASIPGTGISYVEETNGSGGGPGRAPRGCGCLFYAVLIPLILVIIFSLWFLVFREADEPSQPSATVTANPNTQIVRKSEEELAQERERKEATKKYLTDLGFEISNQIGFKITVTHPDFIIEDSGTQPENWDDIYSKVLEASTGATEKAGQVVTLYLYGGTGLHCMTALNGKATYNVFDIEPSPSPSANKPGSSASGITVWISGSGKKYHSSSTCSSMSNPRSITLSEAISKGYTACKTCH